MNALNIISARVSPPSSPGPSKSNSLTTIGLAVATEQQQQQQERRQEQCLQESPIITPKQQDDTKGYSSTDTEKEDLLAAEPDELDSQKKVSDAGYGAPSNERSPLLGSHGGETKEISLRHHSSWQLVPTRIASTVFSSIGWVLSTLAGPGVYLIACLYDETGSFAPLLQLRKLVGYHDEHPKAMAADNHEELTAMEDMSTQRLAGAGTEGDGKRAWQVHASSGSSSSSISSESESDLDRTRKVEGRRSSRSRPLPDLEELAPARRSIRIKLHSEGEPRQRKQRGGQSASPARPSRMEEGGPSDISAQLKSPTSPIAALTKYPKTPAPPRPLIPRRQPSYLNTETGPRQQKTLILDLDETLIHSMSKGGSMGTGHMVEVRLSTTYVGAAGNASVGPQHPILYFVHKRPHCDDFLRRVSKWFNLVIFTASVQEYADPVIDWLETDRKYFSGRYYRQHCTFRHGAFIKDLSSVEPDLSKVMILDNSPLSYMFHQDNAIPIQGWINDPTDNDLLHLVPLLEGLQYVSDVRALLALRGGEDGQHMA